ncbi:3-hydroxy acid dehydrogenase / malonic semialdehyde reductase [Tistlia consotensis]|uniref:3-hydroxy acid dehydrogenase / malonic semialdehyde reductase n=1 Tax=Tistlia consotensis USBA 355 TaxID=560819 RepID=A0A1Y6CIR6_9PROT|nr:SDR family oxidoreductase [Tistlia consotensis]SMF68622.1 3-hydroxy acid dehydrogenase / malonic semialdehyde reductase [Tistlia consotensis USBA 355]SNS01116.1 3-hydroxy acid dehydrogenase / malonic semialdehyde reductase [Tistlia consotensis]
MIQTLDPAEITAFVTGVTSGFGKALARRYVGAGAKVVGTGRRADRLDELKVELGENFHPVTLDVRDREAVLEAVAGLPSGFERIDVLVNNAGLALGLEPAHLVDFKDWDTMVDTNIKGLLHCTHALLPGMVERDRGHVVNLSSIAGSYPYPGGNVYGATKAFVTQFSLNLRADLLGKNVRVTSIEPGLAETEFSEVRFKGAADKAAKVYENVKPMVAEDIAESIFWVTTLPRHLNINRMEMMPVMQAFGPLAIHRG